MSPLFWIWIGGMAPVLAVVMRPDPRDGEVTPWGWTVLTAALWPFLLIAEMIEGRR